jgi:hypothetical protein
MRRRNLAKLKSELSGEGLRQPMNEDRSLKKAMALARAPQMHQERMEALLARIEQRLPEIEELLAEAEDRRGEEDGVYRFYHRSFKVFGLQDFVKTAFKLIQEIGGADDPPCEWYCQIVKEGTEHHFNEKTNAEWLQQTRPILEAFWHTKYFVSMMVK